MLVAWLIQELGVLPPAKLGKAAVGALIRLRHGAPLATRVFLTDWWTWCSGKWGSSRVDEGVMLTSKAERHQCKHYRVTGQLQNDSQPLDYGPFVADAHLFYACVLLTQSCFWHPEMSIQPRYRLQIRGQWHDMRCIYRHAHINQALTIINHH